MKIKNLIFTPKYIKYGNKKQNGLFYKDLKIVFNGNKVKIEDEYYDKNVFLKADRALSKLNFLFDSKSKTNLVTLRKFN